MIRRSVREWEYLQVSEAGEPEAVPRHIADKLLAVARTSRVGGRDGEAILIDGHKRLRAQQVVGLLACRKASLEILPKIDGLDEGATRNCLIHMLARVLDLNVSSGALAGLQSQNHDLLEILIRLFSDRLFEAVHRGLPRRYVGQEGDLRALRGRLDVKRQFTVLVASPQKLACRYEELSTDIPLNQIMKAAVSRLRTIAKSSANQRRLAELRLAFDAVSDVPVDRLPWKSVILDRTNRSWAVLLNLAEMLLGDRFQTTSSGADRGFSLLFEMNTLFEEYVGRTLKRALAHTDLDVRLQGPREHALIGEDAERRFATRPDVVISQKGRPLLIIDTKWKRLKGTTDDPKLGVGQSDVYQMMAYAHVYQCDRLMLLYPHHDKLDAAEGVLGSYRITGTENTKLGIASISLSETGSLANRLKRLVETNLEGVTLGSEAAA